MLQGLLLKGVRVINSPGGDTGRSQVSYYFYTIKRTIDNIMFNWSYEYNKDEHVLPCIP